MRSARSKNQIRKTLRERELAPRARFELATLRLTAEAEKNLSPLSGVAYDKSRAIFPRSVDPILHPNLLPKLKDRFPVTEIPNSHYDKLMTSPKLVHLDLNQV